MVVSKDEALEDDVKTHAGSTSALLELVRHAAFSTGAFVQSG